MRDQAGRMIFRDNDEKKEILQKCAKLFVYVIFLLYLCSVKGSGQQKQTIMEAALRQDYQASRYHSLDEFADKLAKKLGQHYGMNDIRELLQ